MIAARSNILPTSDGSHDRGDLALWRRAIKRRWPIKPEMKAQALAALNAIIADGNEDNRTRVAALKTLATMEGQNQIADMAAGKVGPSQNVQNNIIVKVEFDKAG